MERSKKHFGRGLIRRSILPERPILGEALLAVFAHALRSAGPLAVTARGYLHDLNQWREWLVSSGGKPRDLRRVTVVDLVNYRKHLLHRARLQATTINRKLQAIKKLLGWALEKLR